MAPPATELESATAICDLLRPAAMSYSADPEGWILWSVVPGSQTDVDAQIEVNWVPTKVVRFAARSSQLAADRSRLLPPNAHHPHRLQGHVNGRRGGGEYDPTRHIRRRRGG